MHIFKDPPKNTPVPALLPTYAPYPFPLAGGSGEHVIDDAGREFPLLFNRMDDEYSARFIGTRRARDIVNVEAGDCRRHDRPVAINHWMMDQRDVKIAHGQGFLPRSRSGRRRSVRERDSLARHARILP